MPGLATAANWKSTVGSLSYLEYSLYEANIQRLIRLAKAHHLAAALWGYDLQMALPEIGSLAFVQSFLEEHHYDERYLVTSFCSSAAARRFQNPCLFHQCSSPVQTTVATLIEGMYTCTMAQQPWQSEQQAATQLLQWVKKKDSKYISHST